jgi:hypothetical protein
MSSRKQYSDVKRCSFCDKSQYSVKRFIFGPNVHICNECVDLCIDILVKERYYSRAPDKIADRTYSPETKTGSAQGETPGQNNGRHPLTEPEEDDDWTPETIERSAHFTKMGYLISDPPSKEWLACFWQSWRDRIKRRRLKPEIRFDGSMLIVITRPNKARSYEKIIAECIRRANKLRGN